MAAKLLKLYFVRGVRGRKAKKLKAKETVHGQHQAVDNNYNIIVDNFYGLPKTAVAGKKSLVK